MRAIEGFHRCAGYPQAEAVRSIELGGEVARQFDLTTAANPDPTVAGMAPI